MDLTVDDCVFLRSADAFVDVPPKKDAEGARMFFCVSILASHIKRSSLLQGVSGTSGMTKLPRGISEADFLRWLNVRGEALRAHMFARPIEELCRILLVADAMGDHRLERWAQAVGERAVTDGWCDNDRSEDLHAALVTLPEHTRTAVLQAMLSAMGPATAFTKLQPPLHGSIASAMINPTGSLKSPGCGASAAVAFMAHLPALAHAPVRSLHISGNDVQVATAHLLADALGSFCWLTRLSLARTQPRPHIVSYVGAMDDDDRTISCRVAVSLFPALARATNLLSLDIQVHRSRTSTAITSDALQRLAHVLSHLTRLQDLSVSSIDCSCCGRFEAPHKTCNAFLSTVASHPSLTSLTFEHDAAVVPVVFRGCFPRLRRLAMSIAAAGVARPSTNTRWQICTYMRMNESPPAAFPALTKLRFNLEMDEWYGPGDWAQQWVRWLPIGVRTGLAPNLRSMSIGAGVPGPEYAEDLIMRRSDLWRALTGAVAVCPRLEHLRIYYCDAADPLAALLPHTPRLAHLTSLSLEGGYADYQDHEYQELVEAVPHLHSLQRLQLCLFSDAPCGLAELLRTLGALPSFSDLALGIAEEFRDYFMLECNGFLGGLEHITQLQGLSLSNVWLSDPELLLRSLPGVSLRLQRLSLRRSVTAEHYLALEESLPLLRSLTRLDLHDTLPTMSMWNLMSRLLEAPVRQHELRVTHSCAVRGGECGRGPGDGSISDLAAEVAEVARGIRLEYRPAPVRAAVPARARLRNHDMLDEVW